MGVLLCSAVIACYTTNLDKNWDSARQEVVQRMIADPDAGADESVQPLDGVSTQQALENLRKAPAAQKSDDSSTTLIHLR
jgi:hypothetical protein